MKCFVSLTKVDNYLEKLDHTHIVLFHEGGKVIDIKAPVVKISQFSPLDPNSSFSFAVKIISLA